MGSIGTPELIVILVIALVIFGPGKLPEVVKLLVRASMNLKMLFRALKKLLMKRKKPLKRRLLST